MREYDDEMIDMAAYGSDDDRPDDDDAQPEHDPAAERIAAYLDTQDAAEDRTPGGDGESDPAGRSPIVAMLARRWASESNGAGELPADWMNGEPPF